MFPGKVASVGAFLDPQTRVAHARVEVENPDGQLKGEMYVSVEVKETADAQTDVALPAEAVVYEDGKYYVFVQNAAQRFTRRPVTLEREAGLGGAEVVVRGLSPEQNVVTQGSLLINDVMADARRQRRRPAVRSPCPKRRPGCSGHDPAPAMKRFVQALLDNRASSPGCWWPMPWRDTWRSSTCPSRLTRT